MNKHDEVTIQNNLAFSPIRFKRYAADLSKAVMALSHEVKDRDISRRYGVRYYTQEQDMSITGFQPGAIRAAIDAAKKQSQAELAGAMGELAVAQTRAAEVPAAIKQVAKAISKEAADALQELAEFSNGGPLLEDEPPATPLPVVGLTPPPLIVADKPHIDTGAVERIALMNGEVNPIPA
jgi:hypothetical protein